MFSVFLNLLFIYFWLHWSSLLRAGFLQLWRAGATLHCVVVACCGARALGAWASVVVARRLQSAGSVVVAHRLSCSAACGIFPGPGLEPMSPALAGGFLTTAPPGKPMFSVFIRYPVFSCGLQTLQKTMGRPSITSNFLTTFEKTHTSIKPTLYSTTNMVRED